MILGLSYGFHDSAAALVVDGQVVAAVEEERLSRTKHDASFPAQAADTCLAIAGATPNDIELVACHEKPIDVVDRHLRSRLRSGPRALRALWLETPQVIQDQLGVPHQVERWFAEHGQRVPPVVFAEHHLSHAAAAFYPSPYNEAAILTVDGVGEHATTSIGSGLGRHLSVSEQLHYPHSVGLLYSAFTSYCGFRVNGGEGELMGLAPFGEPLWADTIRDQLVEINPDGSITLDERYFGYVHGRRMTTKSFHRLFGGPPTPLGAIPTQREADLAASIQVVLEEIVLGLARRAHANTGAGSLCLAGGVALNCVANGRILRDGPFESLWVQPAAGDAGSALGAAMWAWHTVEGHQRTAQQPDGLGGGFLGPGFDRAEVEAWLSSRDIPFRPVPDDAERAALIAGRLSDGDLVGVCVGRMEFGPRALGHRSILADPRSATVQRRLNAKVKERAAFRPFAPAILVDRAGDYFDATAPAPYMNVVTTVAPSRRVAECDLVDEAGVDSAGDDGGAAGESFEVRVGQVRSTIPAVTHVDHSARMQTVAQGQNPNFHRLLTAFDDETGCPLLLNTSFNARDEPIVCTPEDAYRTFRRIGLDLLVLEHCLVEQA